MLFSFILKKGKIFNIPFAHVRKEYIAQTGGQLKERLSIYRQHIRQPEHEKIEVERHLRTKLTLDISSTRYLEQIPLSIKLIFRLKNHSVFENFSRALGNSRFQRSSCKLFKINLLLLHSNYMLKLFTRISWISPTSKGPRKIVEILNANMS